MLLALVLAAGAGCFAGVRPALYSRPPEGGERREHDRDRDDRDRGRGHDHEHEHQLEELRGPSAY